MGDSIFFSEKQVARDYFNGAITTKALQKWRLQGGGPPFVRIGGNTRGRVLYRKEDLDVWVESRKRQNTSDQGAGR